MLYTPFRRGAFGVVSLCLSAGVAGGQASLESAGWLAGCWEARGGNRAVAEMWMAPAGGLMVGSGRTVVGDVARSFEHLRIHVDGAHLVYTAIPSGQRETAFRSTVVTDTLLVFENLAHDFPQRIRYHRRGADSVVARVEGPGQGGGGAVRGFDIAMRRTACTGG
jgi:hypothetical protein